MSWGEIGFVAGLPSAVTRELLNVSELRTYRDAETVFTQGGAMPGMLVVVEGGLKVFQTDGRGKVQVVDFLPVGACAGVEEAFGEGMAYSGAQALGHTECWLIPRVRLLLLAARNPTVTAWASQYLAARIRQLIALLETISLQSIPERVAHLILEYQERNPHRNLVEFGETQEDLAQRVGISRRAFNRALRLLADLGLIKNMFPVVRILDAQKLHSYLGVMGRPESIQAVGGRPWPA